MTTLETPRLRLQPAGLDQTEPLLALWQEASVRRFLFDDRRISEAEAREWLEASAARFREGGLGLWCVHEPARPEPLGFAGFLAPSDGAPDLAYGLHPDARGQGYAHEAAARALAYAWEQDGVERVVASVDEPNTASVAVLERLGFQLERRETGGAHPVLYYALARPG